jgi:hypothetical protein
LERSHTTLHALPAEFVLHRRKKKNDARNIHNQTDKEAKQTLQIRKKKNDARTMHRQTSKQNKVCK